MEMVMARLPLMAQEASPLTYLWNTGSTGVTINNLSGGTDTSTITDNNG